PGFFDWPSLFMYISTIAFVAYFQIGRLFGRFPYEVTFLAAAGRDQSPLRLITRGLSAAAGVLTVATLHAIGLRLFDRTTALASIAAHLRGGHAAMAGPGWMVHLYSSLRYGIGLPLLVAGIGGLVLCIVRDRRFGTLFVVFPVAYYALIGAGETAFVRYILPVIPFLCLAAAHLVVEAARLLARAIRSPEAVPSVAWSLAIAAAAPSIAAAVRTDFLLARTDNRLIAADWIRQQYPAGVTMAQTGTVAGQVQMTTA